MITEKVRVAVNPAVIWGMVQVIVPAAKLGVLGRLAMKEPATKESKEFMTSVRTVLKAVSAPVLVKLRR